MFLPALRFLPMLAVATMSASCAVTPQKLIENGEEFRYTSSANPLDTAWCMGRSADEMHTMWKSRVRPMDSPGTTEMLVKLVIGPPSAVAVAHLEPIASGSSGSDVTLWISRNPPYGGRNTLRERLIGDCSMK